MVAASVRFAGMRCVSNARTRALTGMQTVRPLRLPQVLAHASRHRRVRNKPRLRGKYFSATVIDAK